MGKIYLPLLFPQKRSLLTTYGMTNWCSLQDVIPSISNDVGFSKRNFIAQRKWKIPCKFFSFLSDFKFKNFLKEAKQAQNQLLQIYLEEFDV
ncbi:MAG: hypothetical protein ACPLKS_06435 [Caldisericum exile]|uniref:hypothetical protein n=1 Tax=Caldisericum exile TaxID=693075 RepID=UPI003C771537